MSNALEIIMQNDGEFVDVILLLTLCHETVSWSGYLFGGLAKLSPFGVN
jgi:hypothetical protein